MAIAAACVSAAALALRLPAFRLTAAALAALLLVAALDDVLQLHKRGDDSVNLLVYAVLAASVPLLWYVPTAGPTAAARVARIGLAAVLLSVAIGAVFHWLNPWLLLGRHEPADAAFVTLKQGLELAGWVLIATGLSAATLSDSTGRRVSRTESPAPRGA